MNNQKTKVEVAAYCDFKEKVTWELGEQAAFLAGFRAGLKHGADIALAIDSGRGNEKEIARIINART